MSRSRNRFNLHGNLFAVRIFFRLMLSTNAMSRLIRVSSIRLLRLIRPRQFFFVHFLTVRNERVPSETFCRLAQNEI